MPPSISSSTTTATTTLPGTGRPQVTIGDKNFTEQFVLGELYRLALKAQGFDVAVDRNIGPTEVTLAALKSGRIDLYPEYLSTWDTTIAADGRRFRTVRSALAAGRRFARGQGLWLLRPTPFSRHGRDRRHAGATPTTRSSTRSPTCGGSAVS